MRAAASGGGVVGVLCWACSAPPDRPDDPFAATEDPAAEALLAAVDAAHASAVVASFRRVRTRASRAGRPLVQEDWMLTRRDGAWRREVDDHVWGDDLSTWWAWSERAGARTQEHRSAPLPARGTGDDFEPYAPLLPPYRGLAQGFVATDVTPREEGVVVTVLPRTRWPVWWSEDGERARSEVTHATLAFDADLLPVEVVVWTAEGLVFTAAFDEVRLDDPTVDDAAFRSPAGRPVRLGTRAP